MSYTNVMIDIEALDVAPTNRAVVVSVGLVRFDIREQDEWPDLNEPGRTMYFELPMQPQINIGRTVDANTLIWWFKQPAAVQKALLKWDEAPMDDQYMALQGMLEQMQDFLLPVVEADNERTEVITLWAKPVHFDCPKFATLFTDYGIDCPVPWWAYKCMSSYKVACKLAGVRDPKVPGIFDAVKHNALYDAMEQVLELQGWYQGLRNLSKV